MNAPMNALPGTSLLSLFLTSCLAVSTVAAQSATAPERGGRVDDSAVKIKTADDIQRLREALIRYTWGKEGWPSNEMPEVKKNVACPIKALKNFQRCDSFSYTVKINETVSNTSSAWHLLPKGEPNRRLVIFNPGHVMNYNDGFPCDARTIDALLAKGFSVVAMLMPLNANGNVGNHNNLFDYKFTEGSAFKIFFEPIAAYLNYLKTHSSEDSFPRYTEYDMVGLSGGGWTSTVYPAIDPTITISIPVAGSLPIYMRHKGYPDDAEQTWPAFYGIAGYLDLHVMNSFGPNRKQVQVLNRKDDACFGEKHHAGPIPWEKSVREYESRVASTLKELGAADHFRVYIDEAANGHEISVNVQDNVILRELGVSEDKKWFIRLKHSSKNAERISAT